MGGGGGEGVSPVAQGSWSPCLLSQGQGCAGNTLENVFEMQ